MLLSAPLLVTVLVAGGVGTTLSVVVAQDNRPNFIVMQPDDLQFYEEWLPPAHIQTRSPFVYPANSLLPNMNRLRNDGVKMMHAYTASPKCGTSRYSTMTGRFPSRSSYSRLHDRNQGVDVSSVEIPTTKLQNEGVADGEDCRSGNLAALFQMNGYRTGVVGKWHLLNTRRTWGYADVQEQIRQCGFHSAEAIYKENLGGWTNDEFHHNMEYVASRAIKFIDETPTGPSRQPFFLYANPTVPHGPSVLEALQNYSCTNTTEGYLPNDPYIHNVPNMTADYNGDCEAYRQSVFDRAAPSVENADLGAIWADDAVGAILHALERKGELDNTFFLFQQDHGQEAKDSIWEQGSRIAQFVHFPNGGFASDTFNGVVSTVDIGPTMVDFAGNITLGLYGMDGKSWKSAIQSGTDFGNEDRCIIQELDRDRAVVCGCDKYMRIYNISDTSSKTVDWGLDSSFQLDFAQEMLFDLCDGGTTVVTTGGINPEETNTIQGRPMRASQLSAVMDCHIAKTDPDEDPVYSECTVPPGIPTDAPTPTPTRTITDSPTSAPVTDSPTSSPVEADTDGPQVGTRVPPDETYLGDITSYTFEAEVTDDSTLDFVDFEFIKPSGTEQRISASASALLDFYELNHPLDEEGIWEWRINTRDVHRNRLRSDWHTFSVARTPYHIAQLVRNDIEEVIADASNEIPPVNLAAKLLRMGFHDCVGGCDGCIDMLNDDNAGLDIPINYLEPIVGKFENSDVSRADIWAIATLTAADVSLPTASQGRFPHTHVGRINCEHRLDEVCPNGCDVINGPDRTLPSPDLTTHEILDFFNLEFGFTSRETVVVMGAHTLGSASPSNSGFDGPWVNNNVRLDNAYYGALVGGTSVNATLDELMDGPGWDQESVVNTPPVSNRTQWINTGGGIDTIMTNSDMALVRDLNNGVDPNYLDSQGTGVASCRFKCNGNNCNRATLLPVCPLANQTLTMMAEYKHDNDMFVNDFEDVMIKMMNHGYDVPVCNTGEVCTLASSASRRLRGGGN